ncbi:protein draper [Anoplophora glabripennis]|uniref:protein draper n=1 Tax=Anoplophora glabripennis TaxID=217634 RepID=UPI000C78BD05|nr:protein draper [Anoplophora glabripennis]
MSTCKVRLPTEDKKDLRFKNYNNKEKVPFTIYADFESVLMKVVDDKNYQHLVPVAVGYYPKYEFLRKALTSIEGLRFYTYANGVEIMEPQEAKSDSIFIFDDVMCEKQGLLQQKCNCKNGASCSSETGQCQCPAGWEGQQCDRPCSNNSFGIHCNQKCVCKNGASCNPVNGNCTCGAGFTGEFCENKCEQEYFGINCEQICVCYDGHYLGCDPITGKCICRPEWKGVLCESNCQPGRYGSKCDQICNCKNNSSCDPQNGKCFCSRGWQGEDCSTPCKKGYYGIGCRQKCPEVALGNKTCDHITGEYICPAGYLGLTCEHPCPIGKFGKNCQNICSCKNGGDCHHVTGM